jgi:hypothetical protein
MTNKPRCSTAKTQLTELASSKELGIMKKERKKTKPEPGTLSEQRVKKKCRTLSCTTSLLPWLWA